MLSTTYPQVILLLGTILAVLNTIALLAGFLYFKHLILHDFPGRRTIDALRMEVSDFSGMHADLVERFNRFQKKEDMRAARDEKAAQRSILEEAQAIAMETPSDEPTSSKLDLWKRPLQ